jgi:plastocyanin
MNCRSMRRWSGLAVAATVTLALSACGDGDGRGSARSSGEPAAAALAAAGTAPSAPGAGGSEVEVVAKDIAFESTEITVGAAPTKITLRNDGAIPHSLVIAGAPNFEKLEVATNGASDSAMLDVAPGTYTAYCDQPGHRAAGMEIKLNVG